MGLRRKSASVSDADVPTTITVVPPKAEPPAASSLPSTLRFPLYIILSFSLSALSKTLVYQLHGPSLEPISRDGDPQFRLVLTTLWKLLELSIAWSAGFDVYDTFYFTILAHLPHAFLLHSFYLVPQVTVLLLTLTTGLSNSLPLRLLRRPLAHNLRDRHTNEQITSDRTIRLIITLLASLIYSLPVLLSYTTWLPQYLAVHFAGLRTLDPAHKATLPRIVGLILPLGYAALRYSFAPAAHALSGAGTTVYSVPLAFDPVTASLSQTLHRNILWHLYLPSRTQDALRRTATLMAWTVANTAFWASIEIEGCEIMGALGWALIWGLGAGTSGLVLSWVAGVFG